MLSEWPLTSRNKGNAVIVLSLNLWSVLRLYADVFNSERLQWFLICCSLLICFQANLKRFMEHVHQKNVEKVSKWLEKGLDPNFHDSDSGGKHKHTHYKHLYNLYKKVWVWNPCWRKYRPFTVAIFAFVDLQKCFFSRTKPNVCSFLWPPTRVWGFRKYLWILDESSKNNTMELETVAMVGQLADWR